MVHFLIVFQLAEKARLNPQIAPPEVKVSRFRPVWLFAHLPAERIASDLINDWVLTARCVDHNALLAKIRRRQVAIGMEQLVILEPRRATLMLLCLG